MNKNPKNLAEGGNTYITISLSVTNTHIIGKNIDKSWRPKTKEKYDLNEKNRQLVEVKK